MVICDNLVHPFQNDPGTSQRQRVITDLLSGPAKIDGRNTADLLDYFVQLSRHVNYYHTDLGIGDWQPFFQKSLPFLLSAIIKYNRNSVTDKMDGYAKLFDKRPSKAGLQLLFHYLFHQVINPVNTWHLQLKGSGLPAELIIEKLIKDKLREPLRKFVCLNSAGVKWYCVKAIDFRRLSENEAWGIDLAALLNNSDDCKPKGKSKRKRLIAFGDSVRELLPAFLEAIRVISDTAAQSVEQSLFPLKEELQKQHTPHLALLFAFLKLFEHLQGDLNRYTRKHLDFFYNKVLKLKPREAVPDKAHVVFEIQKQLDKYLLKKGLLVKDGKDANKSEILFALEDEIVVNKTQVADKRTLFLNNQDAFEHTYVEGVYMAPDAGKADGVNKDFKDADPKSFPTLGAKLSKYTHPEKALVQHYPNARIGFVLASPVLLLNEGKRTIDITIACQLKNDYCDEVQPVEARVSGNCCKETTQGGSSVDEKKKYPRFIKSPGFYEDVAAALTKTYYYVSEDLIVEAVKKGVGKDLEKQLRNLLIEVQTKGNSGICYCPVEVKKYDTVLTREEWLPFYNSTSEAEKLILSELIKPRTVLRIYFSGEKEWIEPKVTPVITMTPALVPPGVDKFFLLKLSATLDSDQPAVTFYDKKNLKEDFNTTQPLVKVELDDKIKRIFTSDSLEDMINKNKLGKQDCKGTHFCITQQFISDAAGITAKARSYLSSLISAANKFQKSVAWAAMDCFLDASDSAGVPVFTETDKTIIKTIANNPNKQYCNSGPHAVSLYHFFRNVVVVDQVNTEKTRIDVIVCGLKNFIVQNEESVQDVNAPVYPFGTRPEIIDFDVVNPAKPPLANPNLIGPNFYIGSKEIFCKKWDDVSINFNWKDKPSDFNEYYLAYWADPTLPPPVPPPGFRQKYGLDKDKFEINLSVLQDGKWKKELQHPIPAPPVPPPPHPAETTLENPVTHDKNRKLFPELNIPSYCEQVNPFAQTIYLKNDFFDGLEPEFNITTDDFVKYDTNSKNGFLKINLQNQDFLHKDYAFVLARQMMALGKYPDALLEGAVYREQGGTVVVFKNFGTGLLLLRGNVNDTATESQNVKDKSKETYDTFNVAATYVPAPNALPPIPPNPERPPSSIPFPPPPSPFPLDSISDTERDDLIFKIRDTYSLAYDLNAKAFQTVGSLEFLEKIYSFFDPSGKVVKPLNIPIPNEPWTPIIKNISLDYKATAANTDIDFIHLYPYEGTYKKEKITLQPALFPTYCDEGTLFIGLKDLVPGSNVNMLFQLAEATADSESEREAVNWHYLDNNQWKTLRNGFEVLDDATDGLTTSGIVKFALPENMTKDNTILPKGLHWIKASIPKNSKTVSETIGIYTQAIRATFTNEAANDKLRLAKPLAAGAVSKLNEADTNIKKLVQPFDSFGGRQPEAEGHFYVRVSELLRHKGRAIQKFDYERLALEAFPQLFKVKCINHSFALNGHKYKNDFPVSPGYVLLAVIPDLNQLKAAQSFEPRVPVSMLDDIQEQMRKLTSPFVQFRAMNPRYEKIHFCLTVKLLPGKDQNYYTEKLKQDLREFMAPWAVGKYDKLSFGQCVSRSEMIRFLEMLDYVDYIIELVMRHDEDAWPDKTNDDKLAEPICPKTPRSILIAGNIDVCIPEKDCEQWQKCFNQRGQEISCCNNDATPVNDYCSGVVTG